MRRRGRGEGAALAAARQQRVRVRAARRAQRRAARHVLPVAAQHVVRRRRRHGAAAVVAAARGRAADRAREAALAELAGYQRGARALRVVGRPPAHLRLDHATDLGLARVRLPDCKDVSTFCG